MNDKIGIAAVAALLGAGLLTTKRFNKTMQAETFMAERAVRADTLNYPPKESPITQMELKTFNDYNGYIWALRRNMDDGSTFPTAEQKKDLEGFEQFFKDTKLPFVNHRISLFQQTEQELEKALFFWLANSRISGMQSEVDSVEKKWNDADPSMKMSDFLKSVENQVIKMLDHNEEAQKNYGSPDIFSYPFNYPKTYYPVAKTYDEKGNPHLSLAQIRWGQTDWENVTVGECKKDYYLSFFTSARVNIRYTPPLGAILNHMFTAPFDEAKAKKEIKEFLKSASGSVVFSVSWWLRFFQMNPEIVGVRAKSVGRKPARDYFYKSGSNTGQLKRLNFALPLFEAREQTMFKEAQAVIKKLTPEMRLRIDALGEGIQEATNKHWENINLNELGQAITSYDRFDSDVKLAFYEYVITAMRMGPSRAAEDFSFPIHITWEKDFAPDRISKIVEVAKVFNIPISRREGEDVLMLHLPRYANRTYANMDEMVKQTILYDSPPTTSDRVKVLGEAYNSGLQSISDVNTQHNANMGAISQQFYRQMADEKARFEKERSHFVSVNETIGNMMKQI